MPIDVPALFTKAQGRITKLAVDPALDMLNSVSGGDPGDANRLLILAGRTQGLLQAKEVLEQLLNEADKDSDQDPHG